MAAALLALITCCYTSAAPRIKARKHKRRGTVLPASDEKNPPTTTSTTDTKSNKKQAKQQPNLQALNEERIRRLAAAGALDVPHGVLSAEAGGTPEVVPGYWDVVGADGGQYTQGGDMGVRGGGGQQGQSYSMERNPWETSTGMTRGS